MAVESRVTSHFQVTQRRPPRVVLLDGGGFSPPYDLSLSAALREQGVEARLETTAEVMRAWRNPDAGAELTVGRSTRMWGKLRKAVEYADTLRRLAGQARRHELDVVHVQWLPLPPLDLPFVRAIKRHLPVVYTMHNTSTFHEPDHGLRGWGKREAYSLFDRIVVHSEYSRQSALRSGVARADQLRVIPHGAFSYYRDYATAPVRPAEPVQLLFAGSIKPYKGLDVLIEALPQLASAVPVGGWHLTVAGAPSMGVATLQARAQALGVSHAITWNLRHQTERELANLFAACHAVVLPYREIDQSGVLLAAVGTHRPVVASAVGAFPEIVTDGEHGLLVPHSDVQALGQALVRMVEDHDLRTRGESAMRELSETTLHWSRIAERTVLLYRELLQT